MADYHTYPPIGVDRPLAPPREPARSICLECLSRVCHHMDAPLPQRLSSREAELVRLLAGGLSNKEIAKQMGLTEGSVKVYISHIFHKLRLTSRWEVGLWGLAHMDLIKPPHMLPPVPAPEPSPVTAAYLGSLSGTIVPPVDVA